MSVILVVGIVEWGSQRRKAGTAFKFLILHIGHLYGAVLGSSLKQYNIHTKERATKTMADVSEEAIYVLIAKGIRKISIMFNALAFVFACKMFIKYANKTKVARTVLRK